MGTLDLACRCGKTALTLDAGTPRRGDRLICYCADCRAHLRMMGAEERLTPGGGTEIYHTVPSKLSVTRGRENLACLRQTEKGPLRWYAACCDTPVAATMPTPAVPFSGIVVGTLAPEDARDAALGPVTAAFFRGSAEPGAPDKPKAGIGAALIGSLPRILGAVLRNDRATPFFDGKAPIAEPRELWRENAPG